MLKKLPLNQISSVHGGKTEEKTVQIVEIDPKSEDSPRSLYIFLLPNKRGAR